MALTATLYTFRIDLADQDRGHYQQLRLKVPCHPSETLERLVARVLAWCLVDQQGLRLGPELCDGDESPLMLENDIGDVVFRVEMGEPDPLRIKKGTRRNGNVMIFCYTSSAATWWKKNETAISAFNGVQVVAVDFQTLSNWVADLPRQNHWQVMISDRTFYLSDESGNSIELPIATWLE